MAQINTLEDYTVGGVIKEVWGFFEYIELSKCTSKSILPKSICLYISNLLYPDSANKFTSKSLIALSSCCVQGSLFTPPCNAYFASHSDAYEHVLTIANLINVYFSIFLTFKFSDMSYGLSCNWIVFGLGKGFLILPSKFSYGIPYARHYNLRFV